MEREELAGWLRLTLSEGVGNDAARKLLAAFGPPSEIFRQSQSALGNLVSVNQSRRLMLVPEALEGLLDTTWKWLNPVPLDAASNAEGAHLPVPRRIVTLGDPGYPASLLNIEDPPLMLYLMGSGDLGAASKSYSCGHSLAIVGSRNPTAQGQETARAFSQELRKAGLTIISGLALGIDAAAHLGAMEPFSADRAAASHSPDGQLDTIAVVGTGLDRVYPKRNLALAHRIARQGLIISEFPLGTPPLVANFPRRNRIISGLAQGTLVVEATLRSGSLITARLAAEQGKEVFAIPGSIHSIQSRGCHALIRQGAKLVETAQDVLEELKLEGASVQARANGPLDEDEGGPELASGNDALLQALGHDPVTLDALQARTGLPTPQLQAQLMALELDGVVARLPGGLFQQIGAG